jgi:hypothetical protein
MHGAWSVERGAYPWLEDAGWIGLDWIGLAFSGSVAPRISASTGRVE